MWWGRRAPQVPCTTRKTDKWVLEQIKPETPVKGGKKDKTETALLQAHHKEAELFGRDNNAGKTSRRKEKRETNYEMQ